MRCCVPVGMSSAFFRSKGFRAFVCLLAGLVAYSAYDLFGPRSSDLRQFDPDETARLETEMWRSYYAKERLNLFLELAQLLRSQYRLPFLRSNVTAYRAARAAFVFKEGKQRADYEKALPYLVTYYQDLRAVSTTPFDVDRVSQIELEWWIVHRERANHDPNDLVELLAELPAEIYHLPRERFMEHARLRAEAMLIRDTKADQGGVTEEDWARIDALLHESWRSLHKEVQAAGTV